MGARLYNHTTRLFTSLDPEYQGGDTAYGYPNDPINTTDLVGRSWSLRNILRRTYAVAGVAAGVTCLVATAGLCGAAAGIAVASSVAGHGYRRYRGGISRGQMVRCIGTDFVFSRFRAVRAVRARYVAPSCPPRRAAGYRGYVNATRNYYRRNQASNYYYTASRRVARHSHPLRYRLRVYAAGWSIGAGMSSW